MMTSIRIELPNRSVVTGLGSDKELLEGHRRRLIRK